MSSQLDMTPKKERRVEAVNDAPYLSNRPESFVEFADVILKLDSGERLPVHSAMLSSRSDVLSDMLSLKTPGDSHIQVLPFPDCTLDATLKFLHCIYASSKDKMISVEGAETVAELAMKFCMDGVLKDIDKFLADMAAPDGSSSALWGKDVDKAVHWLIVACKNNLMRLAAKAERFLVQAEAPLSGSCEALHIPPFSLLRTLDSRRDAIKGMLDIVSNEVEEIYWRKLRYYGGCLIDLCEDVPAFFEKLEALEPKYDGILKAERFLLQAEAPLSGSCEAMHIPPSSLLRMLDSCRDAIKGIVGTVSIEVGQIYWEKIRPQGVRLIDLYDNEEYPVREFFEKLEDLEPNYPSVQ